MKNEENQRIRRYGWSAAGLLITLLLSVGAAPVASADYADRVYYCWEDAKPDELEGCYDVGSTFGGIIRCSYEDQLIAVGGSAWCGGALVEGCDDSHCLGPGSDMVRDKACTPKDPCLGHCEALLCVIHPFALSPIGPPHE